MKSPKVGRNSSCYCGSGRKLKNCCKVPPSPEARFAGVVIDRGRKTVFKITRNALTNQLQRDSSEIGQSFDRLCSRELKQMSNLQSPLTLRVSPLDLKLDGTGESVEACLRLLLNANHTFIAALQLLRSGFRLQPGILARSILESLSTVLYILMTHDGYTRLKAGRLDSAKTITRTKAILPPLGRMYGFFSNHFVHLGAPHFDPTPLVPYAERDDVLSLNLSFLKASLWLLYIVAELLTYEKGGVAYWKHLGGGAFEFNPWPSGLATWQKEYLGMDLGDELVPD